MWDIESFFLTWDRPHTIKWYSFKIIMHQFTKLLTWLRDKVFWDLDEGCCEGRLREGRKGRLHFDFYLDVLVEVESEAEQNSSSIWSFFYNKIMIRHPDEGISHRGFWKSKKRMSSCSRVVVVVGMIWVGSVVVVLSCVLEVG